MPSNSSDDRPDDFEFWDLNEKDDWQTPPDLIADLQTALEGIDLDPCAHPDSTIAETNWCLEDGTDGLVQSWDGYETVFINPPFSYKSEWLAKATEELTKPSELPKTIVTLTPDSTDTKSWWHEYIATHANYICFSEGRIAYYTDGNPAKSPTFGTAISVFGDCPDSLLAMLHDWGHVVKTISPPQE